MKVESQPLLDFLEAALMESDPSVTVIQDYPMALGVVLFRLETAIECLREGDDDMLRDETAWSLTHAAGRFRPIKA